MENHEEPDSARSSRPILPPELEREIFELTARNHPGNAVTLALVSRRAQIWIEAIIYETVTLSNTTILDRFLYALDTRPTDFFATHVKSLCIPGDIEPRHAHRILNACQGIINLACWPIDGPLFSSASSLRPQRLSMNTRGMFGTLVPPDFRHPFFKKVTHLEIVDWLWNAPTITGLEILPSLTHLAIDCDVYDQSVASRLSHTLSSCQHLRVLLCLVPNDDAMILASAALESIQDVRLVILSDLDILDNWEASLKEGTDDSLWTFAEAIVAAKSDQDRDLEDDSP